MNSLRPSKRHLFVRKYVVVILTLIILSGVTIYYVMERDVYSEPFVVSFEPSPSNVSCYYSKEGDVLPSAEDTDFSPRPNSIFFHETSCNGRLTSRQACAMESAARAHPRRQVYILFNAPVIERHYRRGCIKKLRLFPNIHFARVHIIEYSKGTPLEELIIKNPMAESQWWMEHTSDVLRYLTLFKWGGVYLDMDMIVTKSLTPLGHNWVAKEDNQWVNSAAIAISMDHLGRKLSKAVLKEVSATYRPDIWSHNGPGAITRVLHRLCSTDDVNEWSSKTCRGLEVYAPENFFPLHYSRNHEYFEPGELSESEQNAYTHHFWSQLSHNTTIEKDSPYEKMAQQYCPTIYELYGDRFGE